LIKEREKGKKGTIGVASNRGICSRSSSPTSGGIALSEGAPPSGKERENGIGQVEKGKLHSKVAAEQSTKRNEPLRKRIRGGTGRQKRRGYIIKKREGKKGSAE